MSVRLISHSVKAENFYTDAALCDNVQDLIAYSARVSNPSNQMNTATNEKLIRYLIKNNHWPTFEIASAMLEITTTRDIARQILRHRSFSFQEFSQRYADPTQSLGYELSEARLQDSKNRQNSIEVDNSNLQNQWKMKQNKIIEDCQEVYKWAIDNGIAKELARKVLPEGLTQSRLYMAGTIRSWIHLIQVRHHPATQKEFRCIAEEIKNIMVEVMPGLDSYFKEMLAENYKSV